MKREISGDYSTCSKYLLDNFNVIPDMYDKFEQQQKNVNDRNRQNDNSIFNT